MGRGGSVSESIPPMPDFSGIGRVITRAIKIDWIERTEEERTFNYKNELNVNNNYLD